MNKRPLASEGEQQACKHDVEQVVQPKETYAVKRLYLGLQPRLIPLCHPMR